MNNNKGIKISKCLCHFVLSYKDEVIDMNQSRMLWILNGVQIHLVGSLLEQMTTSVLRPYKMISSLHFFNKPIEVEFASYGECESLYNLVKADYFPASYDILLNLLKLVLVEWDED